jgi:signal transduction histidine kinase
VTYRPWRASAFLMLSLFFGTLWFVLVIVMIALTIALSITVLGVVIGPATVWLWRNAARLERWRVRWFLGIEILPPFAIPESPDSSASAPIPTGSPHLLGRRERLRDAIPTIPAESIPRRLRRFVTDGAAWRELAYLLILFPVCIIEFVLFVALIALTVAILPFAILLSPFLLVWWIKGRSRTADESEQRSFFRRIAAFLGSFVTLDGIVAITAMHVNFARSFLGRDPNAELKTRVETLTRTRTASVDAALAERRRIERDLHDGAQQRLVKLAMDLGMAQMQMETNPDRAQELIANAHEESKLALAELRDLVRGIHPAILTDRGLDAAISAVADRSHVPIDIDFQAPARLPESVESTAYFVIVEALTNIDKHSGASNAGLSVRLEHETLMIEVIDNGAGGAGIEPGGGLAGLRDRLAALDGALEISSPPGGPTRLHAEIPCALSSLKTQSSSERGSPGF